MRRFKLPLLLLASLLSLNVQAKDKSILPQVLVIGDSIYNEPVRTAAALLKGRVKLTYGKNSAYHSGTALENFDKLLDGKKWDLIHFNFGMNDLMYKAPGIKEIRAMHKDAGGVRVTSPQQYEKNLRELVKKFKATGAKLIWAATTPIVGNDGVLYAGDEVKYNTIAAKVMKETNVTVNDMHSHGLEIHKSMNRGHGKTFSYKGGTPLHPPMSMSILKELNLIKPVKGPVKVFVMIGGAAHQGNGKVIGGDEPRKGSKPGSLDDLVLNPKTAAKYKHLLSENGQWATRSDVWLRYDRRGVSAGAHGVRFGGDRKRCIGSEYGLGLVLGQHYKEQVLIYKTDLGTPSLSSDLVSPSAGKKAGKSYTTLLTQVKGTLTKLENSFPDYTEKTGYEISGLVINLGENDKDKKAFAKNLPLFIKDLRKEFKKSKLPVVIVGSGQGGRAKAAFPEIIKYQQVTAKLAEFTGNVIFTETRDFWADPKKSPGKPSDSWYGNAESFYRMGIAIGQDMKKLLK
jgi:hypothetical protein